MTRTGLAFVTGVTLMLAAAAPAHAERFAGMSYRGGLPGTRHATKGTLVLEGGELRFEDRRGRVVFALPIASAQAWVGAERRTTAASIVRSAALFMVAVPLSVGQIDPLQACSRDVTPLLVVQLDPASGGVSVRWRGPMQQLQVIADAINRAREAAAAREAS